jgi:hypothetical protein
MTMETENYIPGTIISKPTVRLTGTDGNAFAIIGKCALALRRMKVGNEIIDNFRREATSGDYDHLLQTAMKYCDVE